MVNYGMIRQQTFEEVARLVELDDFNKSVPKPNRIPKFVLESMELSQIDPNNEEEIVQFEQRKREQELKKQQIEKVSQERGVSRAVMQHAMREPPNIPQVTTHDDDFERRTYTNSLEEATRNFYAAVQRSENVRTLGNQLRQELGEANRSQPHIRVARSPDQYFLTPPSTPPNELDIRVGPAVPAREILNLVGSGVGMAAGGLASGTVSLSAAAYRNSPSAAQTIQEALRLAAKYGPAAGQAALTAGGISASILSFMAQGLARGAIVSGNALSNTASAASDVLAVANRGSDHSRAMGINLVHHVGGLRHNMF